MVGGLQKVEKTVRLTGFELDGVLSKGALNQEQEAAGEEGLSHFGEAFFIRLGYV